MSHSRSATAPSVTASGAGVSIPRRFTEPGKHPFDCVEWEIRDALIGDPEKPAFEQKDVEFPVTWSQNATNIVAQKYFRGRLGSPERESSVKQMIGRVAGTIAGWGREGGYFASDEDAQAFEDELTHILLNQMAAFNSPVWFNVGFEEQPAVLGLLHPLRRGHDRVDPRLEHQGGQDLPRRLGLGDQPVAASARSKEHLSKGGLASGPVSFMRGADAWAGTIKSGGKTRRAAKMVVLDVDHPDILDFIWCKAREEEKAAALRDAGFDMRLDSESFASIQYQNANNSVRVTDEFMERAERGEEWELTARVDGSVVDRVDARDLLGQIADAAWRCADPGVQYDTTINEWHTCPNSGRINASNPCSEYMHVDDSACNLASLNLMKFRRDDGTFDVESFEHAVDVMILAQEIVVSPSSYPTEEIGVNARAFRQLGLGYANLGALLMANGLAYDSDEGRDARRRDHRADDRARLPHLGRGGRGDRPVRALRRRTATPHNHVMRKHRDAAHAIDGEMCSDTPLLEAARRAWDEAVEVGERNGYRNAQATVLAPTGHDLVPDGLRHDRHRARLLAGQVQGAGRRRADDDRQPHGAARAADARLRARADRAIEAHLAEHATIVGAPGLSDEHLPVFDVAVGERAISPMGHVKMMAAAQPFISGAISKTVNLPESVTVEDIAGVYTDGWKLGLKALAIYRDGSKTAQALKTDAGDKKRRGGRRRRGAGPAGPAAHAARAPVAHPQVLGRRARGLHHRGRVRGRVAGRGLPDRRGQGGLDDQGPDERVRHGDLDRAPVRRAARDVRAQVRLRALRAGGLSRATRRSRSRSRCPTTSCAGWPPATATPTCTRSWASSRPRCGRARPRRRR